MTANDKAQNVKTKAQTKAAKCRHDLVVNLRQNWSLVFLTGLLFVLTWHSWFGPDVWYHMTWGRDVVSRLSPLPINRSLIEQPLVANVYWLFQSLLYEIFQTGGIYLVSLVFSCTWLAVAWIWLRTAKAVTNAIIGPVVFFAFIFCMQLRFDQRPEILAYLFLALQIRLLASFSVSQAPRRTDLILLLASEALCANTHGYFALGPMLGGAYLVSVIAGPARRESGQIKQALLIFMILAMASVASPFALKNWQLVLGYEKAAKAMSATNVEMFPTTAVALNWVMSIFWAYWLVILAASLWSLVRFKNLFSAIVGLAGCYLGYQMYRNIPLFILFAAPMTAQLNALSTARLQPKLREVLLRFLPPIWQTAAAAAACAMILAVVTDAFYRTTASLASFSPHLEWASYPIGAVEYLRKIDYKGRIFTDSYDGGYVEFHMPEVKISGDSYFYDGETTLAFFAAIKNPRALREAIQRLQFDALLINVENADVLDSFWRDPDWVLAYTDSHRTLFLRSDRYQNLRVAPAAGEHYHGEDLRDWVYAFGPVAWAQYAFKYNDRVLLLKLLSEFQRADVVPSAFLRTAFLFASYRQDAEVLAAAKIYAHRYFESEPGDREVLEKLMQPGS